MLYNVTVPTIPGVTHPWGAAASITVDANTAAEAAELAVARVVGNHHNGLYRATERSAAEVAASGRVHPAPQDEVVISWSEEWRTVPISRAVTVARPVALVAEVSHA